MLRVLHYGMGSNLGGIETYLRALVKALVAEGVESHLLYAGTGDPSFREELESLGAHFHIVPPRSTNPLRNYRDVRSLLQNGQLDLLHHHAASTSYAAPVRLALASDLPVIWHSHNAGPSTLVSNTLHRINRRTLPWAQIERVAVSERAGAWAFGKHSFTTIPNGIDLTAFHGVLDGDRSALRNELGIDETIFVIGHIATFLPVKNHEFSLLVLAELLARQPRSLLLLVGSGPLEPKVRQAVDALGLGERVRFLGARSDVNHLLPAMDAVILPSHSEGFPMIALEAQATGVPIFTSEAVPLNVLVAPNAFRIRLSQGPSAWAEQISSNGGHTSPASAQFLQNAGFTIEANAKHVLDMYEEVINGR